MKSSEKNKISKQSVAECEEKIQKNDKYITALLALISIVALGLAILSVPWEGAQDETTFVYEVFDTLTSTKVLFCTSVFSLCDIALLVWCFQQKKKYQHKLETLQPGVAELLLLEKMNRTMDEALRETNYGKVRNILRITYDDVTKWNPINVRNNVLIYDVHEHIRSLLTFIKSGIISFDPERFDANNVSVDLAYQYPLTDEEMNNARGRGMSPYCFPNVFGETDKWKIISSGDNTGREKNIDSYTAAIARGRSFYSWVYEHNFAFINNKSDEKQARTFYKQNGDGDSSRCGNNLPGSSDLPCYIWDPKDTEMANTSHPDSDKPAGSIVGVRIDLRNDDPEMTLVSSILTINTYGQMLFEGDGVMKLEDYINLFRKNVIDNVKSVITAELAQMYVRHMIRDKHMCPYTGRVEKISDGETCDWRVCNFTQCIKIKEFFNRNISDT